MRITTKGELSLVTTKRTFAISGRSRRMKVRRRWLGPLGTVTFAPFGHMQPSKNSFPGDRKDRNAAHSRVYRLLKKNRNQELAGELTIDSGADNRLGRAEHFTSCKSCNELTT